MIAYFDCFSGASGDMILGALVDAGLDVERLSAGLAGLSLGGWRLSAEKTRKQGFAATQVRVEVDPAAHKAHRHLKDVAAILERATLSPTVKSRGLAIFRRLAEAEAEAHGSSVEKVHFHEVGAVDAIVDIIGAALAVELLGIQRVVCSAIPTGSGTIQCEHGILPVPAPGTAALLRGVPLLETDEIGELTTPTGAAILTTLCGSFGPMPAMRIERIGYGAGQREGRNRPNVLRVLIGPGEAAPAGDTVVVLEANLDDVSSEAVGHCMSKLLAAGALDAWCVPITMKKSRPGVVLTVLAAAGEVERLEEIVYRETTTFGIRRRSAERSKLERRYDTVDTPYGEIRVKVGMRHGRVYTAAPEFEDCARAAEQAQMPVKEIMRRAMLEWEKFRV